MTREKPGTYTGIGLVLGAGIGSVLGLLIDADIFFLFTGGGALLGIIAGSIADQVLGRP